MIIANYLFKGGGTKSFIGLFSCETKESCEIALALCILVVVFVILLLVKQALFLLLRFQQQQQKFTDSYFLFLTGKKIRFSVLLSFT